MQVGVLANRTVLELGSMIAAPFAAHILGQLGAEVVKVEPPSGDTTRKLVRGGPSGTYIAYNRGKKSICLDLRAEAGQEVFRRLVERADIVVHNLSPGAARRLGISYDGCAAINPRIVYCHIKGYGVGPLQDEIASNPIAEAATGVMYGHRIEGKPARLGPSYHDQFAGSYAVIGILGALLDSSAESDRRNIEVGLYETGLHIAARDLVHVQLNSQLLGRPEQEPSPEFSMPGYGAYKTHDGRWIYLVMLTDEHWRRFCTALSIAEGPELGTLRQRRRNRPQVEALVTAAVREWDYSDLVAKLSEAGVGHTEVLPPNHVLEAPQARAPGKYSQISFGGYDFQIPDLPLSSCAGAAEPQLSAPLLGQDTQLLLQRLGYGESQIKDLVAQGAALVADASQELWGGVR